MLVIATSHLVGATKSSMAEDPVSDWESAVSLIMKDHNVNEGWIAQIFLISNDFLIRAMVSPAYQADPFYLIEDVSDFAEMDLDA